MLEVERKDREKDRTFLWYWMSNVRERKGAEIAFFCILDQTLQVFWENQAVSNGMKKSIIIIIEGDSSQCCCFHAFLPRSSAAASRFHMWDCCWHLWSELWPCCKDTWLSYEKYPMPCYWRDKENSLPGNQQIPSVAAFSVVACLRSRAVKPHN